MSDAEIPTGTEGGTPVAQPPAQPETIDQTLDRIASEVVGKIPVHGSDGKFQPKVEAPGAPEGSKVPGGPQTAQTPDPQPEVIEAPQSLPADVKAKWGTLPPDVQKFWAEREGEVHKKFTADGERLKSLSAWDEVSKAVEDRAKQVNAPATEYVRRLHEADKLLTTDGPAGLRQIAEMYGIDPRAAFGAPAGTPDPNGALAREVHSLKSQLHALTKGTDDAKLGAAQQTIDAFAKDKPHFKAVEGLIVTLIEGGAAKGLEDAYQMAIKAHPEVSVAIEAEAKAAAAKKAAEEAKAKADKDAKLRPLSQRPSSTPTAPLKGKSWEDTVDRISADISSRA